MTREIFFLRSIPVSSNSRTLRGVILVRLFSARGLCAAHEGKRPILAECRPIKENA